MEILYGSGNRNDPGKGSTNPINDPHEWDDWTRKHYPSEAQRIYECNALIAEALENPAPYEEREYE
jgi:hypothetical protein